MCAFHRIPLNQTPMGSTSIPVVAPWLSTDKRMLPGFHSHQCRRVASCASSVGRRGPRRATGAGHVCRSPSGGPRGGPLSRRAAIPTAAAAWSSRANRLRRAPRCWFCPLGEPWSVRRVAKDSLQLSAGASECPLNDFHGEWNSTHVSVRSHQGCLHSAGNRCSSSETDPSRSTS